MTVVQFFADDWKQFAIENKGEFRISKPTFGFGLNTWLNLRIEIPFMKGKIVYHTSEASFMKIFYDFKTDIGLNFLIYHEDYLDKIEKYIFGSDVEIGDDIFDKMFMIKSKNEMFVRKILNSQTIDFLIRYEKLLANFKLDLKDSNSLLELNAPFDETDMEKMDKSLSFMKEVVANIYDFWENNPKSLA